MHLDVYFLGIRLANQLKFAFIWASIECKFRVFVILLKLTDLSAVRICCDSLLFILKHLVWSGNIILIIFNKVLLFDHVWEGAKHDFWVQSHVIGTVATPTPAITLSWSVLKAIKLHQRLHYLVIVHALLCCWQAILNSSILLLLLILDSIMPWWDSVCRYCVQHKEVILFLARSVMSSALLSHSEAISLHELLALKVLGSINLPRLHGREWESFSSSISLFILINFRFHISSSTISVIPHCHWDIISL